MIDFNHVWNTIPFPAFIINSEFKIIEGNSSAEQIIHTSRNQMFGKELGVFFWYKFSGFRNGQASKATEFVPKSIWCRDFHN